MSERPPLDPTSPLTGLDDHTVGDFWAWAYSALHENTVRPVLAEYIVGSLLGVERGLRQPWACYDLEFEGHGVEVKSSAYVQAWHQTRPSVITFDIARKVPWYPATNTFGPCSTRSAAVYVFALWPERDPSVSPLDLTRWQFLVAPTRVLDERFGSQKSVRLATLQGIAQAVGHDRLREVVRAALLPPERVVGVPPEADVR